MFYFFRPLSVNLILKRLAVAGVCFFFLAIAALVVAGVDDHAEKADLIVVPGNTILPDGSPSPRLRARLDAALGLYQAHWAPLIFVSGGVGKEGFDEAKAMAAYLMRRGVPAGAIVQDRFGVNTEATARNAARFMAHAGLRRALVATQYFHVPRTRLLLERRGVLVVGSAHARFFESRDVYSTPREVIGYAAASLE